MNKCTCGAKTADHSIFCSGDFYIDPMSEKKYTPKKNDEKMCERCFLLFKVNHFKKDSDICIDCI